MNHQEFNDAMRALLAAADTGGTCTVRLARHAAHAGAPVKLVVGIVHVDADGRPRASSGLVEIVGVTAIKDGG